MIRAHIKYVREISGGKTLEESDIYGILTSISYRHLYENNTSDVNFDYVILNIGGVEYDLAKCTVCELTYPEQKEVVAYTNGNITANGVIFSPPDFVAHVGKFFL